MVFSGPGAPAAHQSARYVTNGGLGPDSTNMGKCSQTWSHSVLLQSFPHGDPQTLAEVDKFLEKLESFIGIKREVIDLEQSWREGMPSYAAGTLAEYFRNVSADINMVRHDPFLRQG